MAGPRTELPELPDDVLARMNLTREAWNETRARFKERQESAPKVGVDAPDFELPYLGETDKTVRLSDFRGKRPVALIFGSYT